MAINEAALSAEIRDSLETVYSPNIYVKLFPDMRRTFKKPYDFEVLYRGNFFGIECKFCQGGTFNFKSMVYDHQPKSLRKIDRCGGAGLFCIGFKGKKKAVLIGVVPLDIMLERYSKNGNSLTLETFQEHDHLCWCIMDRRKFDGITRWHVEKIVEAKKR